MRTHLMRAGLGLGVFAAAVLFVAGCSDKGSTGGAAKDKDKDKPVAKAGKPEDDSETWWCKEHGVPEHDCALCKKSLVAEFKKKGDWCEEHARPESHCFLCNAKRAEKFAAEYRARYGKEPPPIEAKNIKGGKK